MHTPRRVTVIAGQLGGPGYAEGPGVQARFAAPFALAWSGNHVLVADQDNHCVRRVDPETGASECIAGSRTSGYVDGNALQARFAKPAGLAVDASGVVYIADQGNHAIRRFDPARGEVSTIAGSRTPGASEGTSNVPLNNPGHLALHGHHLFVADTNNYRIRQIDLRNMAVTNLAGNGTSAEVDGPAALASFKRPGGLWCTGDALYVGDYQTLRRIDLATGHVTTVAGGRKERGDTMDGVGTDAYFDFGDLTALTGDSTALYLSAGRHGIRRVALDGFRVTSLASGWFANADGSETAERWYEIYGLAVRAGSLLAADHRGHCIRKIDLATEVVSDLAGRPATRPEGTGDGIGTRTAFDRIRGLTVIPNEQRLYVAEGGPLEMRVIRVPDRDVWRIKMYEWAGKPFGIVATAAGPGEVLYVVTDDHALHTFDRQNWQMTTLTGVPGERGHTDGAFEIARLHHPSSMCGAGEDIFIAEDLGGVVRHVRLDTRTVTTLAGGGDNKEWDAVGLRARFGRLGGIASDGAGAVFVADWGRHSIRRIDVATRAVTTLAGNGEAGVRDGVGDAARFDSPTYLTYAAPYLYVSDVNNHAIRRVHAQTGEVVTVIGGSSEAIADPGRGRMNRPGPIATLADGSLVVVDTAESVIFRIEL